MFSVIIPVHNSGSTIEDCLDSLICQTFKDFEVLLIANGCKDNSVDICQKYERADSRFKLFITDSCNGPSRPRNIGISLAVGEYVVFLDSDDYVEKDMLEELQKNFSNHDAVFFGYIVETDNSTEIIIPPEIRESDKHDITYILHTSNCFGFTCCKAYKTVCIKDRRFNEQISLFEDEIFTLDVLALCSSIGIINKPFYHYVKRFDSVSSRKIYNIVSLKDLAFDAWVRYFDGKYPKYLQEISDKYIDFCRFYFYENKLSVRLLYKQLLNSKMIKYSSGDSGFSKRVMSGWPYVLIDYIKWRLGPILKYLYIKPRR